MTTTNTARIAVVGASGYTGAELIDLLLAHPRATPVALSGSARQEHNPTLAEVHPRFTGRTDLTVSPASTSAIIDAKPDAVMLATPHEAAIPLAAELLTRNIPVIDLSAAFRLSDPAAYPEHYNFEHAHPELLPTATYGLPELPQNNTNTRDAIRAANLIACPGCYPTASILGIAPAVRAGLIATGTRPIIDATSGISGAGRAANQANLFCETSQRAYNVFAHRHQPEINQHAGIETVFTPHVGPYDRGILATIHLDLTPDTTDADLRAAYAAAYEHEPFVTLRAPGTWPAINDVARTNNAHIALAVDEAHNHAIVVVAIDNLLKGASGQAVQCMNLRLGFNETDGLRP